MKKTLIFVLVLILSFFVGCTDEENNVNNSTLDSSVASQELKHQQLKNNIILNPNLILNDWMTVNLPEVGLENLVIGTVEEGNVVESEKDSLPVYVFCDYRYGADSIYHDSYLAVVTDSKILLKDLSETGGSYATSIYLHDVDGDGLDEIIVQQTVGMTGGAGQFASTIFRVIEDDIVEMFPLPNFDTGFTCVLKDGFKIEISNRFTGYATTIDYDTINGENESFYFNENGKVRAKGEISLDSFYEFVPEDIDGDGIYEIVCKQYVSLQGHSDYIGDAESVLKFNPSTQKFEIIKAEFIK
ncbi:MAG: hypothetical protein FWG69_03535 [Oscillospiraceae bacterium]|nr:hypothetical protein [Oscillospiraceae bacterium]